MNSSWRNAFWQLHLARKHMSCIAPILAHLFIYCGTQESSVNLLSLMGVQLVTLNCLNLIVFKWQ